MYKDPEKIKKKIKALEAERPESQNIDDSDCDPPQEVTNQITSFLKGRSYEKSIGQQEELKEGEQPRSPSDKFGDQASTTDVWYAW